MATRPENRELSLTVLKRGDANRSLRDTVSRWARRVAQRLVKGPDGDFPVEATALDREICRKVAPYTMTSTQRIWALISATKYVVEKGIQGDFVECGVWRGGSAMAIAYQLARLGIEDRPIWLYDTFSGMTAPTNDDVEALSGRAAAALLAATKRTPGNTIWCVASKEDVLENLRSTAYPEAMFHLVEGDVRETLEDRVPERIALLRLDTDWYESTKAELDVLFPRLTPGGVCIIDDYGHWRGARKAVDEYLSRNSLSVFMHCIDATGRLFLKV